MENTLTQVLDKKQIDQTLNRLAFQIYEDCAEEREIILAGIADNGLILAERLCKKIEAISPIRCSVTPIELDKRNPLSGPIKFSLTKAQLEQRVVILVDDVLNSGKTLIYALNPFLEANIKKLRTTILVDRNHKNYPISADFVGISLATTLHEHITVQLGNNDAVYLS